MRDIITGAFRFSLVSWILCGFVYPLLTTFLAQALFPYQSRGSLASRSDGTVIGSMLIGQDWSGPRWFHGRPSATLGSAPENSVAQPYNASNSGGSNLGPTSKLLAQRLLAEREALERVQPELAGKLLPADTLTTSASGLDPDISVANARMQAPRIAAARSIPERKLQALIEQHLIGRSLGIFGEPRVSVLELNLAIERAFPPVAGDRPTQH
jgi:potassium-transporting ATPase KdpC subunit